MLNIKASGYVKDFLDFVAINFTTITIIFYRNAKIAYIPHIFLKVFLLYFLKVFQKNSYNTFLFNKASCLQ